VLSVSCGHKKKNVAQVPPAPRPVPHPQQQQQPPQPLPVGYVEEGIASWYGIPFNGRHAADGEIYDMETLVAAHKLMPFNTWLRVTNLANGKTVNVRIIDRGPFVEGRIIDLSKAAARQINMLEAGISRVRLEVIAAPRDIASNDFYAIQVGVFTSQTNAEQVRAQFAQRYGMAQILVRHGAVISYRVLVGKFSTVDDARQLANIISGENPDIFIVRLDETPVAPVTNPPPNFPAPPQH
jgi:rare lipoprotein A